MTAPDQRPELSLPWQRPDRVLERLAAIGLLLLLAAAAVGAFGLPSRVPIHFSVTGRPDAWGSRGVLLALPVVVIVLYVGLSLIARVPHWYNYPTPITAANAAQHYALARRLIIAIKALTVWAFLGVFILASQVALGLPALLAPWLVGVLVLGIGAAIVWYFRSTRHINDGIA